MNKNEYLNEENYQKTKKKLTVIALIVLIAGVVIGVSIIATGVVLSHNAKGYNIKLTPEENKKSLRTESEVEEDIIKISPKVDSLNSEVNSLKMELWSIQMKEGLSDNYYAKQKEKEEKETELLKLNAELEKYQEELQEIRLSSDDSMDSQLEQFEGIFNGASSIISKARYTPFYMIGGFIIIASCIASFSIFMFAKKREITAFTVQQTMPVAQEGIEKMASTVGNAGKELARGIKEGLNEENNEDK